MYTYKTAKGTELPLMDLRGKSYLEVKWRLVWFREERPTWSVETDYLVMTDKEACAKAIIKDEAGRVIATGHKFEDKQGFADFREKAETGAIGRALALIGYGTQFCADELDEGERLADAPVQPIRVSQGVTSQPPIQNQIGLAFSCCGNPMQVSRFNPNEMYCARCKSKKPRSA